jgi:Leucine carboxyl methyltransferase
LDSFAYRQPDWARAIEIVDHPRTQEFKIELIKRKGLRPPQNVSYLPVDFASESVIDRLAQAGANTARPIFVSWLGVTQYLAPEAVSEVLRALASWPGGCGLLVTYMLADWSDFEPQTVERYKRQRDRAASLGEPWISGYSEAAMAASRARPGSLLKNPSLFRAFKRSISLFGPTGCEPREVPRGSWARIPQWVANHGSMSNPRESLIPVSSRFAKGVRALSCPCARIAIDADPFKSAAARPCYRPGSKENCDRAVYWTPEITTT